MKEGNIQMAKKIEMTEVYEYSKNFKDLEEVEKALRSIQSKKCRFLKMKERKDYTTSLTKILQEEQLLKEVKNVFSTKKTTVTNFCQDDIKLLNYAETVKAIKSIQSKKCNCQYMSDKTEFDKAVKIEQMLIDHKKEVAPISANCVEKSKIQDLMKMVENVNDVDKNLILQKLEELL